MEMRIDEAFKAALEHHRSGDKFSAEALYKAVVSANSSHLNALNNLSILYTSLGQFGRATERIDALLSKKRMTQGFGKLSLTCCCTKRHRRIA